LRAERLHDSVSGMHHLNQENSVRNDWGGVWSVSTIVVN
jgi:hypothetical protein